VLLGERKKKQRSTPRKSPICEPLPRTPRAMLSRRDFLGSVLALIAAPAALLKQRDSYHVRFTHHETIRDWRFVVRPVTMTDRLRANGGDAQQAMAEMLRQENEVLRDMPWSER
jgi:hypothetical protein